jgi:hypothetical protein
VKSIHDLREVIKINNKSYLGVVDRTHRFILVYGHIPVTVTDRIEVIEMPEVIIQDVQYEAPCTLVRLG